MKSFILSIPDNLKKANKALDAKSVLCGNSWEVFNDDGIKQVFIFNKDNTLFISTNGDVLTSSWQYIPTNNSIIITTGDKTFLFRPAFCDNVIFALQKDGTEECYFLINENNLSLFPSRKLEELKSYFYELELSYPENERRLIELEHKREEEAQQKKIREEKEAKELLLNKNNEKRIIREYLETNYDIINKVFRRNIIAIIIISLFLILAPLLTISDNDEARGICLLLMVVIIGPVSPILYIIFSKGSLLVRRLENEGKQIRFLSEDEITAVYKEYKASINKIA
ncbi:MAG: hypothetical protein MJY45_04980 [Bacteroidales bacterium]|nr:hypothetical protein [Bacteroidales bacterium]